jgi:hypothetical protein
MLVRSEGTDFSLERVLRRIRRNIRSERRQTARSIQDAANNRCDRSQKTGMQIEPWFGNVPQQG